MLKIGEFANLFNISIKTVRFYEEKELFKPSYIDEFSGYRYYDENNINEMTKILYLKGLGFSLDEIKNYNETQIKDKIEEYENKIIKLKNDINDLIILKKDPQKKLEQKSLKNKEKRKDIHRGFLREDYRLIGFWKTIDFIKVGQKFNPRYIKSSENHILEKLTVNPNNTVLVCLKDKEPVLSKYTKDYIFDIFESDTMCNYTYKRINSKEYIIVEYKSEDYVYENKIHGYYVLEKIGGNYMEGVFESREKLNTILSEEKKGLVLGKNIYLPNEKRGNINTLVVAGTGGGKSASFTIPNILNCLGSYVVTDPLGEVYEKTHKYLENNGYEVITINCENSENDYKYNPLDHINSDEDIDILADIIMNDEHDPFWNDSAKYIFKSVVYYVLEKEEKKDLLTCFNLIGLEKEKLFEKLDELPVDSKAQKYYSIAKIYPEKTYASIISLALAKLSFVINKIPNDRNFSKRFDFSELTKRKMIIFLICKENYKDDRRLINIFISQILSQLNVIENPIENTYFLLDEADLFDRIYELPRNIQIAKTKKISISLIVNTLNKLKETYENDFYLMLNSIDSQLLLGTNLKADIEYFSDILGIDDEFIKNDLESDKLLIFEKGLKPILAEKDYFFRHEEWGNI